MDEKQELLRLLAAAAAGDDPAGRALGPAARAAGRFAPAQAGAVRAALQTALLSAAPDCAYVPVRAGCFAAFGLSALPSVLSVIRGTPTGSRSHNLNPSIASGTPLTIPPNRDLIVRPFLPYGFDPLRGSFSPA